MAANENPFNESVTFIQHALPGLDAGAYQLTVEQQVFQPDGETRVMDKPYTNVYTFGVNGDRFRLSKPAELIQSVFPGDNASGVFSNVLPHVVFTKATFPWTRYPTNEEPYSPPPPGQDVEGDVPCWLWVMTLDDDDQADNAGLSFTPVARTIGDLYPKSVVSSSSLGEGNFSIFSQATDLSALEAGQQVTDPIQTIDIPLSLFWQLAPSLGTSDHHGDLYYNAHVRKVTLTNQVKSNAAPPGGPVGSFSIVFGNRLPAEKKQSFAFLVSVEWLQDYLPLSGGTPPPPPSGITFGPNAIIRLPVLKSWSFFSTGESASFVQKLEALNGRSVGGAAATNTNIRIDYPGINAVVADALNMGYAPLNEMMRSGEKNVSWYRGPLLPYKSDAGTIKLPVTSPDAAMVFDPTTGMLDVSYAAAWTIGRMVALQDASFSVALYNWKKSLANQVTNHVQNNLILQHLDQVAESPDKIPVSAVPSNSILKKTILSLKK